MMQAFPTTVSMYTPYNLRTSALLVINHEHLHSTIDARGSRHSLTQIQLIKLSEKWW